MPKLKKKFSGEIDKHRARELAMAAANEYELYRTQEAWEENFAKKIKNGKFNRSLAVKGIANNFVPRIITYYNKNYGNVGKVSLAEKRQVAAELMPSIVEGAKYRLKKMQDKKKKEIKR